MAFIYSGEYDAPVPATPRRATLRRLNAHGRIALSRAEGFLHAMIERLAENKIRRVRRELALRGVRDDRTTVNAAQTRE